MPKWRDRECERCKKVEHTASKSRFCLFCSKENARDELFKKDPVFFKEHGYNVIEGPTIDKFNHRCYKVLTPCGHEWEAPFTNILKQVKNAKAKNLRPACGVCGPKHRFTKALEKYIEKYAIDYDLDKANDYRRLVRRMTEQTYKKNKHVINPNNLPRGRNTGYHLDHVVPIIECFKQGWPAEEAADVSNLQMLEWTENLSKGSLV